MKVKVQPRRGRPAIAGKYRALLVQVRVDGLSVKPRIERRLQSGNALWKAVMHYLRQGYSSVQIAGTIITVNADHLNLQTSRETIYSAIYLMPRGVLRTEVIAWLCFGHWEGNLIKGKGNRTSVSTIVEKTTLFTVLAKMENATAASAVNGFSHVLNRIEAQKRLSMTYDQGCEMARHAQLTENTGVKVYFADPHGPWQRGINETTNGLLPQYLPKGEDLSVFTQEDLDAIAWQLNTRPRKSLGFKCPAELFTPDAFDFRQHNAALFALQP